MIRDENRNPVGKASMPGTPRREETVHTPLPYDYIDSLRKILAPGPNFRDWKWAQESLGGKNDWQAADWFPVTEDRLAPNDPDCVWRVRKRGSDLNGLVEMWSPVRWVALLVQLILPLRFFQMRMLDSGEADTWRYEGGVWQRNRGPLAGGTERKPHCQGVFRRVAIPDGKVNTFFYINTNKTADAIQSGKDKGYTLAWPKIDGTPFHRDVYYWLERLRNWQEKYNPIQRPTPWSVLDARHAPLKSEIQIAGIPDTCFLFRLAEGRAIETMLPLRDTHIRRSWHHLLEALELQLAKTGQTYPNEAPIRFVPSVTDRRSSATFFPLHSVRVSLITSPVLEGQVPFSILREIEGYSRILMTNYYTKHDHTQQAIEGL